MNIDAAEKKTSGYAYGLPPTPMPHNEGKLVHHSCMVVINISSIINVWESLGCSRANRATYHQVLSAFGTGNLH